MSNAKNTPAADGSLGNVGGLLQNKLAGQVGLDAGKDSGVATMLSPMVTELVSWHVGGNTTNLQSLIGRGGIAGMAKGLLGELFKSDVNFRKQAGVRPASSRAFSVG